MPTAVPQRNLRVEDELYNKVKAIAKKQQRSFNQQVVYILRRFVDQYEQEHGPIALPDDEE